MRLIFTGVMLLFSMFLFSQSEDGFIRCNTDEFHQEQMKDPAYAKQYKELQKLVQKRIASGTYRSAGGLIIPVAVHYNDPITTANTQCLIDAAQAQIDQMNLDYSACNMNAGLFCDWIDAGCTQYGPSDAMPANGSGIQFYLADQNLPAGEDNIGGFAITVGDYTWPSVPGSTWDGYMNIFVSDGTTAGVGSGILGIAPLGGASDPNGNGFYVLHSAFGSQAFAGCTSGGSLDGGTPYDGGATCTHEAGHYFGLEHTWDDALVDTPNQGGPNYGCPSVNVSTCTCTGDCDGYAGNFMDYVDDDCMFMFSDDQVTLMCNTAAAQSSWAINSISSTTPYMSCNSVCTFDADFSPADGSSINLCDGVNNIIQLNDLSSSTATSWNWSMTLLSGTLSFSPSSSTVQNPSINVSAGSSGVIQVTLMVSDGTTTETVTHDITVNLLASTDPACNATACTEWDSGPYNNLSEANLCFIAGQSVTAPFQVWANESYLLLGLDAGVSYTFDFCNGYSSTAWGAEAVITVVETTGFDGTNWTLGSVLTTVSGCTATFTSPSGGDYIVVLSTDGGCGGAEIAVNNGTPTLSANACNACGNTFTDSGSTGFNYGNDESDTYTICPDNANEILTVSFTSLDIEPNGASACWDDLSVYSGTGTSNLIGTYCGDMSSLPNGGVFEASDVGECFTFVFNSDGSVTQGGWEAAINCCTCSYSGSDYSATDCGCPIAINAGGPVPTTMVDNSCSPSGLSLTDMGLSYFGSNDDSSSRRVTCPITAASPNQSFFAIACDTDGEASEMLEIEVNGMTGVGAMDVALFGPVTGGCPNFSGGSFADCDSGTDTNPIIVNAMVQDGDVYLVIVSTENEGQFSIESTANATALPVELLAFEVKSKGQDAILSWSTASELNNEGFTIQRSKDGLFFEDIDFVKGNGTTTLQSDYIYQDKGLDSGTFYYRLSQSDYDGKFTESGIRSVQIESSEIKLRLFPNPSTGLMTIDGLTEDQQVYQVYDKLGRMVTNGIASFENNQVDFTGLNSGIYRLVISAGEKITILPVVIIK